MEAVILSKEHFEELKAELREIKNHVKKIVVPNEAFIDNNEFISMMNVSFRTAQLWRDNGKVGYSKEGKKIYYRLSDIEKFLDNHHHIPFAYEELERLKKKGRKKN